MIYRPDKPKKEDLINLYDVCNKIFKKEELFYKYKEVEKEKEKIWKKE